jgi:carbamoyl-phosphate synthase small subunit
MTRCVLAFEDGTVFTGKSFGAAGTASGEAVFHTGMTGYQEVLTDPSYTGQIVTMTYPLIGNYGVNVADAESSRVHLSGFVVKEPPTLHSNHRASQSLPDYLAERGVIGLCGVDTRAVTRTLRDHGALRAVISTEIGDADELVERARAIPLMAGQNLAARVAGHAASFASDASNLSPGIGRRKRVVVLDCGVKFNILRSLTARGCDVTVLSGMTSAGAVLDESPDGVLVGNGPGDPEPVSETIDTLKGLIGRIPIFGICLGHQLLACALGAETYKLKFGHHGANHPVRNIATGRVEITSQNHGFAVETLSLERAGARPTHINLNDQSLEGFAHKDLPVFAVQYHPEAAPGPRDAAYLFDAFDRLIETKKVPAEMI